MKKLLPLLILLVIAGVAIAFFNRSKEAEQSTSTLTYYGNVEIRDARLTFDEQGILADVMVDEGEQVDAGQLLAQLRNEKLKAQLDQARAQVNTQEQVLLRLENGARKQEVAQARAEVDAAKVAVDNARQTMERLEAVAPIGGSSRQALDDSRAAFAVAEAQLKVRRQALELLLAGTRPEELEQARQQLAAYQANRAYIEERLRATELHAPAGGLIQNRLLEPGELAGPGMPVLSLALTDPKWIRIYIPEPDLGLVRQGAAAQISCDSWPERTITGHVGFISSVAEFTPKNVETADLRTKLVYGARILVDDPHGELKLGMPATVTIKRIDGA